MTVPYIPLEPSAGAQLGLENMVSFDTGTVSTFYGSISFLWSLGIMICVAGASYALIRSSFYRAEASEAGVRKSKEWFKQAVLGLLGVLLLAMFIDTINKDLRRADFDFGVLTTGRTGTVPTPETGTTNTPQPQRPSTIATNGLANLQRLNNAGVRINHDNIPCSPSQLQQSAPSCTSLEGLPEESISVIIKLAQTCTSCGGIIVTGGTEPGHKTHGVGKYPFDLRFSNSLLTFLKTNGRKIQENYYLWEGFVFWHERAGETVNTTEQHFHVYK